MGGRGGIPGRVRSFVAANVESIGQLELLMLLHGKPEHAFTAAEASRELRAPERHVRGQLVELTQARILVHDDRGEETWHFDRGGRHARAVDELAACMRQRPRAVHDLILSGPSSDVQVFSDAFRLRRDD